MKISFNIGLVKVESCIVLKSSICDYIFWSPFCAFTPKCLMDIVVHILNIV
jgi:hypothetical protein